MCKSMRAQQQDRQRTGREDGEMSVIIAPEGKGKEKDLEFKASLSYIPGLRAAWAIDDSGSKPTTKNGNHSAFLVRMEIVRLLWKTV